MELIDVLDKYGNKTGEVLERSEIHRLNLNHSIVICSIIKDSNILIQQRSRSKNNQLMWDFSVAGHVLASEEPLDSILREIKEELGLTYSKEQILFIGEYQTERHLFSCYVIYDNHLSLNDIHLQVEEVKSVNLVSLNTIKEMINNNSFLIANREQYLSLLEENINSNDDEKC